MGRGAVGDPEVLTRHYYPLVAERDILARGSHVDLEHSIEEHAHRFISMSA
jgi:hypothetical protein